MAPPTQRLCSCNWAISQVGLWLLREGSREDRGCARAPSALLTASLSLPVGLELGISTIADMNGLMSCVDTTRRDSEKAADVAGTSIHG